MSSEFISFRENASLRDNHVYIYIYTYLSFIQYTTMTSLNRSQWDCAPHQSLLRRLLRYCQAGIYPQMMGNKNTSKDGFLASWFRFPLPQSVELCGFKFNLPFWWVLFECLKDFQNQSPTLQENSINPCWIMSNKHLDLSGILHHSTEILRPKAQRWEVGGVQPYHL